MGAGRQQASSSGSVSIQARWSSQSQSARRPVVMEVLVDHGRRGLLNRLVGRSLGSHRPELRAHPAHRHRPVAGPAFAQPELPPVFSIPEDSRLVDPSGGDSLPVEHPFFGVNLDALRSEVTTLANG